RRRRTPRGPHGGARCREQADGTPRAGARGPGARRPPRPSDGPARARGGAAAGRLCAARPPPPPPPLRPQRGRYGQPALPLLVPRRAKALAVAGIGFAYAAIVSTAVWAEPRAALPGIALMLAGAVPAASMLLGRRLATTVVALTIAGNLMLIGRSLGTLWPD